MFGLPDYARCLAALIEAIGLGPAHVAGLSDLRDVLPRIAVPTLLLWGGLDARSPLSVARDFEQAIPGAQLVVIPDAGHMSNLDRPRPFNDAVREFCRTHPPRQS